MSELTSDITWTEQLEAYFVQSGEHAGCLAWLHNHAESVYNRRRAWIDLPVIIGSGAIAFLNGASMSLFEDARMSSIYLGVASLAIGTWNSMGTYFSWSKRAEGHRIGAIHWGKLQRHLEVELGLPRSERTPPQTLLKYTREAYDRLAETCPPVPPESKSAFQSRFGNRYRDVARPMEVNGLTKLHVFVDRPGQSISIQTPMPSVDAAGQSPVPT